jgi:hypothetical protein
LPEFKKRINLLGTAKNGRFAAELYNQGQRKTVTLTGRELKIVAKSGR